MDQKIKQRIKRVVWIALLILPAIFIIYYAVLLADSIWYHTQIPEEFQDANWAGEWRTKQFGMSGRLLVRLPDPLPENKDFEAEALVYYPIYSLWKSGQFVKMDFVGHFSPDNPGTAGKSTNEIPGGMSKGGKLKFKGRAGKQVVDYSALIKDDRSLMVGGYLSEYPHDYGNFIIINIEKQSKSLKDKFNKGRILKEDAEKKKKAKADK